MGMYSGVRIWNLRGAGGGGGYALFGVPNYNGALDTRQVMMRLSVFRPEERQHDYPEI